MGQKFKDWWAELKNNPAKKKKFIAITASIGAACAIALGVVAVNLNDISRMSGASASDLIAGNNSEYNDAGGLIADIDYDTIIGYDADGSPIYGTKGLVDGVGGYDCFGAPIATKDLVVTGTASDGRAIYGGYSAVKQARNRAITMNRTGDIDYNSIVGYDRDGNPIYGSLSGRDDIWGYDANGRPIEKDGVKQTGTTANGMPIYDYSAIDQARIEGITAATSRNGNASNLADVDFNNQVGVDRDGNPLYGSKTNPNIIYDANGNIVPSNTAKTGLTADGKPIYDYSTAEAAKNGQNGANGTAGTNGSNGQTGANGAAGINGTNGANGANGTAGKNGTVSVVDKNGTNGTNGANGQAGANGTNGVNGSTGRDGINGNGYAGMDGQSGANGANGNAGQAGANGTNGTNGTNGKDYTNEINALENKITTLQKALDEANKTGDMTALKKTVAELQKDLDTANKTIDGQKTVVDQQNDTITNYLKVISQLTTEVSELKGLTTAQANSLQEKSEALENAIQNMQGLSSGDKAALEAELLKYKAAISKAESDALANTQSLQSKIDANQAANEAANKNLANNNSALNDRVNGLESVTGSMDNVKYVYTDDHTGNPTITFSPSENHK